MRILPLEDFKASLIGLVANAIARLAAKHQLIALNVVVHHVFKDGHQRLLVNKIEVYALVGGDLEPAVSLDEEEESRTILQLVILGPAHLRELVLLLLLEEEDLA